MLILTRDQNESVIIDDDIKVTVINDKHGQVKPYLIEQFKTTPDKYSEFDAFRIVPIPDPYTAV